MKLQFNHENDETIILETGEHNFEQPTDTTSPEVWAAAERLLASGVFPSKVHAQLKVCLSNCFVFISSLTICMVL